MVVDCYDRFRQGGGVGRQVGQQLLGDGPRAAAQRLGPAEGVVALVVAVLAIAGGSGQLDR